MYEDHTVGVVLVLRGGTISMYCTKSEEAGSVAVAAPCPP